MWSTTIGDVRRRQKRRHFLTINDVIRRQGPFMPMINRSTRHIRRFYAMIDVSIRRQGRFILIKNDVIRNCHIRRYPSHQSLLQSRQVTLIKITLYHDVDSGSAYLGVNLVKYPTYLTCSDVSLSLYPVKFRCCE